MQNLHIGLDFPTEIFKEPYNVSSFPMVRRTLLNPAIHINPEILDIIQSNNLKIVMVELFYSDVEFTSYIHSDTGGNDISKINWIIGGEDSVMNWFEPQVTSQVQGIGNNTYIGYKPDEVVKIHSAKIHNPSLIQAAVPHNVVTGKDKRWAVSLMLTNNIYQGRIKFNDASKHLEKYLLV